jgi:hypothetical protein
VTAQSSGQPAAPSPADVVGQRVVRIIARNRQWTSPPMDAADARTEAVGLLEQLEGVGSSTALIDFDCGDGREVSIRARDILAIETQACTSTAVHP